MLEDAVAAFISVLLVTIGFGFLSFVLLVKAQLGEWGWLRGAGERLRFYLSLEPPGNMVVLVDMDGKTRVYYNARIERTDRGWVVHLPHARYHTQKIKEHYTNMLGSGYEGLVTPYNLGIRAIAGWAVGAYMALYAGIWAWDSMSMAGKASFIAAYLSVIFFIHMQYQKLLVPNLKIIELLEWGLSPPMRYAIPSVGPRGLSPVEFAKLQGLPPKIEVPKEVQGLWESLRKRLQRDDVALARLLALAEEAEKLKVEVSAVKEREVYSRELARHFLLSQAFRLTALRVVAAVLLVALGIVVGYALGGGDVVIVPGGYEAGGAP